MKGFISYLLFFFLLFVYFISSTSTAQQPTQEWVRRYSGLQPSYGSSGNSVKLDSAGNVYVRVSLGTDSTLSDYGVLKYTPSGNLIWSASYNSPGNLGDNASAFAVTGAGDVYITGNSGINFNYHILTVKFDSSGTLRWARRYDAGGPGDDALDIALDKQGNIIIAGGSGVSSGTGYALTVKYNPNGDSLWLRKFTQYQISANYKLVTDDSSNVYTTGYHQLTMTQQNILTVKYDRNGNLMWYSSYGQPPYAGIGYYIAVDSSRKGYVAGNLSDRGNILLKLNSDGIIQWESQYFGIVGYGVNAPKGISVTPDGSSIYYTTSAENGTGGGTADIITLKYNSMGDSVWVRRYWGGVPGTANFPRTLKLDRYNNVYVTGTANYSATGDDYVTIKYLPNGNQQWVVSYNGPLTNGSDNGKDVIVDSSLVYVTGISDNPIRWDAATIKYNQPIGIVNNSNGLPVRFVLHQNYPNPFNSSTAITYELPKKSSIELKVYNSIGQLVRTLVGSEQGAGYYTVILNADNLSSGVYFYCLKADNSVIDNKKLILVK